ncbi:MAG: site-specific integrase, partial [Pseudomonadota bacterium]
DLTNRLNTWAKPSVDRRMRQRPIDEIHHGALGELDGLETSDLAHRRNRIRYRDAMILLLLSACPMRLRNLTGLRIGQQIRREGDRWAIHLSETETKGHNRLAYLLPRHIGPCMARYLKTVRPAYGPAEDSDALWLALGGRPLGYTTVYGRIVEITTRLFGVPINPHFFRTCAATSLVEDAPEAARMAAPLLGHRYFQTTERYYVRAGQIEACRSVNALLGTIAGEETEGEPP